MSDREPGRGEAEKTLEGLRILQTRFENLTRNTKELMAAVEMVQGKNGEVKAGTLDKYTAVDFENEIAQMNLDLGNAMSAFLKENNVTISHAEMDEAMKGK